MSEEDLIWVGRPIVERLEEKSRMALSSSRAGARWGVLKGL